MQIKLPRDYSNPLAEANHGGSDTVPNDQILGRHLGCKAASGSVHYCAGPAGGFMPRAFRCGALRV